MTADPTTRQASITRTHRNLLLAATALTALLISLGGIVCATESGAACPDWPGCYGRAVPPPQVNAVIEYTHRLVAALTSPVIIAAAVLGWRRARTLRWVSRPPLLALVFLPAVVIFGALTVLVGLPPALAALDLGSALIVLALLTAATTVAFVRRARPDLPDRLAYRSSSARLSLAALGAVFAVHISGILVAGKGSLTRCLAWPTWRLIPDDLSGWPQVARLALSAVAALLVVAVVALAWRTPRHNGALQRVSKWVGFLFLVEMAAGVLRSAGVVSVALLVIQVAAAAALWASLVALTVLAGQAPAPQAGIEGQSQRQSAKATSASSMAPAAPEARRYS